MIEQKFVNAQRLLAFVYIDTEVLVKLLLVIFQFCKLLIFNTFNHIYD